VFLAHDTTGSYAVAGVLNAIAICCSALVGPVFGTALSVWHGPAGLLAAAAIELASGTTFALQRKTIPAPTPGVRRHLLATLRSADSVRLLVTVFGVGTMLGTLNVSLVAFTQDRHAAGAAGWLLGGFAGASMVAGLAIGQRPWRRAPADRYRLALLYLAVVTVALPLAPSVPAMAIAVIAAGSGVSPALVSAYTTTERAAPPGALAETLTWTVTALTGGSGAGAALSGWLVDGHDPRVGLFAGTIAAWLAAAAMVTRRTRVELPSEVDAAV
jgi:predicted MFS family arabinose efflux permease